MTDFTLRRAGEADLPDIARVVAETISRCTAARSAGQSFPIEPVANIWWVAEVAGCVVGAASVRPTASDPSVMDIDTIAVEDASWGNGVGVELARALRSLLQEAASDQASEASAPEDSGAPDLVE